MASQALEQILEGTTPDITQDKMYQTIDTYVNGTTHLYSFDPPKPLNTPLNTNNNNNSSLSDQRNQQFNPIGSKGSGFQRGSMGNIRKPLYEDQDIKIQERFDFSGHNNSEPHYNLDYGKLSKGLSNAINNSNKFSSDEKKDLLNDLHYKNLFNK